LFAFRDASQGFQRDNEGHDGKQRMTAGFVGT